MRSFCFVLVGVAAAATMLPAADVDQGLLNLVPSKTQVLAGIHIDQSKSSAFGQYLLQNIQDQSSGMQKLIDSTGFDPKRDVQQVLLAGWSGTDNRHHAGLVLARGIFDVARIKQAVIGQGGHAEAYNGFDILTGKQSGADGFVLLDSTLAVLSDGATIRSIIANRNTPSVLDSELEKRVGAVSAGNDVWFASVMPGTQLPVPQHNNQQGPINAAALQSILQSSGGIHFASDSVNVAFDAVTRTDKDAQSLCDVVRFFASMIQMQRQSESQAALLAPVFDQMRLTSGGNAMHLSLSVPEKTVEQLMNQKHAQHQSASIDISRDFSSVKRTHAQKTALPQ